MILLQHLDTNHWKYRMYNEVEQLILNNFVICPYCESKKVKTSGISTTIAAGGNYYDLDGHYHTHDTNYMHAKYKCINGHKFEIIPINSCWCGWRQTLEKIGMIG